MSIHSKWEERIFNTVIYTVLTFLMAATIYPLLHVLFASFSDANRIVSHEGVLWRPLGFNIEAYKLVFSNSAIIVGYGNTLFIVIVGVVFNLLLTALGAFVLSRKNVFWSKWIMFFILFTMFFSGGLIPMYLIVKGVGLLDSLWSIIIPFAVSTFNLIIMRTAFASIPDALEESAKIDGANHFVLLFRIIIPLSLPTLAVIALYYAVDKWNGWFYASIFLKDRDLFPLQIILREILISNSTDSMSSGTGGDMFQIGETIKYATIVVATLPILCVYPFLQRFFIKGVMVGAVKG
ncbi:carbohydrate ABC transporter permease [Paenibacillus sp. CGMCC 1.16610]|uniref:ABC transporter permease subunit n=1 Tax=Paenibacillus anseongense TaxID=2682845 RepID=A0ABW9UJ62_9BACL|nr:MULTISPECIES: carbohydrate ABC transporter permease [Paenibacillus]MBA2939613.1 carbohydrate ABC transporter permease [Paenibacillus sp. CGMCC 1.16610]MVQ39275.1 ABC transporter permease subunit [Paenibacillus anseongense]